MMAKTWKPAPVVSYNLGEIQTSPDKRLSYQSMTTKSFVMGNTLPGRMKT